MAANIIRATDHDYAFSVTPSAWGSELLTLNFLGQSVQQTPSTSWNLPTISYSRLVTLITALSLPDTTFSLANAFGSAARTQAGKFVPIQQVITWAFDEWSASVANIPNITTFAALIAQRPDTALITISSGGYTIDILGSQIRDGSRFNFVNPPTPNPPVNFGLMYYQDTSTTPATDVLRFVIGQLAANDVNSPMWVVCADGGATISFTQAASLPTWNTFRAFIGTTPYPPNPLDNAYSVSSGNLRFAIDQSDLLNGARFYYTVKTDGTAPDNPSYTNPTGTTPPTQIYNFPSPQFTQGGADYPVTIPLVSGNDYFFKVLAYGPGANDSELLTFRFDVS